MYGDDVIEYIRGIFLGQGLECDTKKKNLPTILPGRGADDVMTSSNLDN